MLATNNPELFGNCCFDQVDAIRDFLVFLSQVDWKNGVRRRGIYFGGIVVQGICDIST